MRKRYFTVSEERRILGVFEYVGDNEKADSLIMKIVCDNYDVEDCSLDNGFNDVNGMYTTSARFEDEGEDTYIELFIEEVGVYL